MPIIKGWGNSTYDLPWESDQVSFIYDSKQGPEYSMFPMTGLLPVNLVEESDLINAPSPLWITYLEPESKIGKPDSKGDKTYRIDLVDSFEKYLEDLSYDSRKEMRYVLRKNQNILVEENNKKDLFLWCDEHFQKINARATEEGEKPFTDLGIQTLKDIFLQDCTHTISFRDPADNTLLAVNVSFRRSGTVYDSFCIRKDDPSAKKLSLGTLAILHNIKFAIRDGFKVYDMLAGDWGYKEKFGAKAQNMHVYIKCSLDFAKHYQIPLTDISHLEK